ncbi:uncharacterized protein G2W53_040716 [Senna tora]|uniref:Uncharacterized protein n=1 Tax=Senna tora TaxID=362788 RepID=A0A834VYQ9_9FABA|nr:uncharacterized protein G2W53_040716 [Senna tora]
MEGGGKIWKGLGRELASRMLAKFRV